MRYFRLLPIVLLAVLLSGCYTSFNASRSAEPAPQAARSDTTSTAARQDSMRQRVELPGSQYTDPQTATLFGFLITGGGQFYAEKPGKGAALLLTAAAAPLAGYALSSKPEVNTSTNQTCFGNACDGSDYTTTTNYEEGNWTPLYIGAGVSVGAWLYGMLTASSDAREANQEARQRMRVQPTAVTTPAGSQPGVKLSVRW